jgi:phosphodiesterase/alkaline phosphatase D-like protein
MKLLEKPAMMMMMIASLLYSTQVFAQLTPNARRAASVRIISGPEMERTDPDFAIVRWTSNNPGGSPERFGLVRYGTDPQNRNQTAKSHIRLNPEHPQTVFRVRMEGLKPGTTYYYTVDSIEADGRSDGVKSPVKQFTTPKSQ